MALHDALQVLPGQHDGAAAAEGSGVHQQDVADLAALTPAVLLINFLGHPFLRLLGHFPVAQGRGADAGDVAGAVMLGADDCSAGDYHYFPADQIPDADQVVFSAVP